MVYQGVVMEVEKSHIIVLTDNTDYVKLKKKGNIDIGKKIMFIEEDIIKKSNKSYKPLLGIAAAIILMIVTIIGQFGVDFAGYFQAYAIVSLDINPSLQFQIDESRIVKKINCLNNDGEEIVDDNMVGMVIEDAVIFSIKKAISKEYLNNENNVVLVSDVILDNNSEPTTVIENEIFEKIEEDKELQDIDLIYVNSDKNDLEKAKENHVSVGKYKVYEIISNNKPEVKVEDIKNKKVSDIVKENRGLTEGDMVKTKKKEKKDKDKNKNNLIKDMDYTKKTKIHDKNHENKNNEKPNHEKKSDEKKQGKGKAEIKGKEVDHNKYKEKEHKEVKNENKVNEGKGNGSPKNNNTKISPDKGFEKKDQENSSKENVKYNDHKNEKAKEHNTSKKENKNNKDNKDSKKDKENNDDKEDKNKKTNNKNKGK